MSGGVVFGSGVAAVFAVSGSGGAGAAALIAIGVLALALAAIGVIPTNLAVGGVSLTLPEQVQRLADEATRRGRPDVARSLSVSAELAATSEPFTQIYKSIREIAPGVDERTDALDALVRLVERQAREGRWSPAEARALFRGGDEGARVFALAMLRASPAAADLDLAVEAATEPRSNFEQWHALVVLQRMVPGLADDQRREVASKLRSVQLPDPGSRFDKRAQVLALVAEQ